MNKLEPKHIVFATITKPSNIDSLWSAYNLHWIDRLHKPRLTASIHSDWGFGLQQRHHKIVKIVQWTVGRAIAINALNPHIESSRRQSFSWYMIELSVNC